jgi:heptaprenyl diphosphate synthase
MSAKDAIIVSIIRTLLVSMLFGNIQMLTFSVAGAALSLASMILLKKTNWFSTITVSIVGGIFHNIGQILVAIMVTETQQLIYYLPVLIISGVISGIAVGLVSAISVKKIERIEL